MQKSYLGNTIILLALAIAAYFYTYEKGEFRRQQQARLSKIEGYGDYRWNMNLRSALEVKDCRPIMLTTVKEFPTKLTVACPASTLFDQPVLSEINFKEGRLESIKFIFLLNEKTVQLYQDYYEADTRSAEVVTSIDQVDLNNIDGAEYLFVEPSALSEAMQSSFHEKTFVEIQQRASEIYGPNRRFLGVSNNLERLYEKEIQKSDTALWASGSKYPIVSATYISILGDEKVAHLELKGPKEKD